MSVDSRPMSLMLIRFCKYNNLIARHKTIEQTLGIIRWYQLRITHYDKDIWKIKNLEKLFRRPLLKTQEKDFHSVYIWAMIFASDN